MWKICDSLLCFIDINGREPWQSLLEKLLFFLDALQSPPATKKTKNNLRSQCALGSLTVTWDNSLYGTQWVLYCAPSQISPLFLSSSPLSRERKLSSLPPPPPPLLSFNPPSSLFFTNLVPRFSLLSVGTGRREPWERGWFFITKLIKDGLFRYGLFISWKFGSLAARPLTLRSWAFPLCVLL